MQGLVRTYVNFNSNKSTSKKNEKKINNKRSHFSRHDFFLLSEIETVIQARNIA